ncbi:putative leucine-rich repeat domain superfamily [Helianthus debilis subsp. tardiflorus]
MGSIPLELGYNSSLQDIDFSYNLLNGSVPASVWNLCDNNKLVSFRVHGNLLSGSIPKLGLPNASCANLIVLDFGRNLFTRVVPDFITGFTGLKEFDVSESKLFGLVPEGLSRLELEKLNLSYNNLSGVLPNFGGSRFGVVVCIDVCAFKHLMKMMMVICSGFC